MPLQLKESLSSLWQVLVYAELKISSDTAAQLQEPTEKRHSSLVEGSVLTAAYITLCRDILC